MNDSVFLFFYNGYDKIGCFGPDSKLPKSITELLFSFLELFKHKELLPWLFSGFSIGSDGSV